METNNVFKCDDDIVARAREILASRAYIKPDARQMFGPSLDADRAVRDYLAVQLSGYDVEHFDALYFSPDGKLLKHVNIGKGTEKEVPGYPREVCRQGLLCNATFVVIAHNHPNCDPTPSNEDGQCALAIAEACETVGLRMVNAYVVAGPTADKVVDVAPPAATLSRRPQHGPTLADLFAALR